MALNKFLIDEVVDISNGDVARVKNYYASNNFVVLFASENNAIWNIAPGMTITGRSSGYSKTLTQWDYSTPENDDYFDTNYNDYAWEVDKEDIIKTDDYKHIIVLDSVYDSYPHNTLSIVSDDETLRIDYEILDFQLDEAIIQR